MESAEEAEFIVGVDITICGLPPIVIYRGDEDNWLSVDFGRTSLWFDNKAHFKAFMKKLTEEAEKI